jgi:hypothetical protein
MPTEGLVLDPGFMTNPSVITVTTLRHPIDRVMSLYWYEHVGWWDGIQHDHSKLKPMARWIEHWRDGSDWKAEFVR